MKKMIKLAGLAKPFLQKEAIAQPNTILVTRMDNGNSDMQFPNGQELDSDMYADASAMAEEKYAMGTKIEFIYMVKKESNLIMICLFYIMKAFQT